MPVTFRVVSCADHLALRKQNPTERQNQRAAAARTRVPAAQMYVHADGRSGKRLVRHRGSDGALDLTCSQRQLKQETWQTVKSPVPASEKWDANRTEGRKRVRHRGSDGAWMAVSPREDVLQMLAPAQVSASKRWDANRTEGKRIVRPLFELVRNHSAERAIYMDGFCGSTAFQLPR